MHLLFRRRPTEELLIDSQPMWTLDCVSLGRPEGVAFSRRGDLVALAHSDANRVSVHEIKEGVGRGAAPACVIEGPMSGLDYPHDVDFSRDGKLLVVANRHQAALTIYARQPGESARYGPLPVWTVLDDGVGLEHCDAVKFVPPHNRYLAAASLADNSITFYERDGRRGWRYGPHPSFVLKGSMTRLGNPDGIAFSPDGGLLAVANHGDGTVTIYERGRRTGEFGPEPLAVLGGTPSRLRCPHSVAFSPDGDHLAVSNAGGRHVFVYRRIGGSRRGSREWSDTPLELAAHDPESFDAVNHENPMEGGGKGVAFGVGCFAVCNSMIGLRAYRSGTLDR